MATPAPADRSVCRRLWLGGLAAALFLGILLIGNAVITPGRSVRAQMLGHDFVAFYTAGSLVRQGHIDELYDIGAVGAFERRLDEQAHLDLGGAVGPWWNPPFYVWPFVPLAGLPFRWALAVWTAVNMAALAAALALLCGILLEGCSGPQRSRWKTWALAPLLVVCSMPFIGAFSHGQNTFCSLLVLTATVAAWRSKRTLTAGLLAGLLLYKPQIGALLAAALTARLGWRGLAGVAITASLLALTCVIWLPGTLGQYLHQLPLNVHFMQVEHRYYWERHVTLKAFWRLLFQGKGPGEMAPAAQGLWLASCAALSAGLAAAWWRTRRQGPDRFIAATIASMPLLMPFYFDYDMMLLAVPAVLLARELLARDAAAPLPLADRWLLLAWAALFAWLFVNPAVAVLTHVNLAVPLTAVVAALLIRRAVRPEAQSVILHHATAPLAVAA
jgi:hypothetical protein